MPTQLSNHNRYGLNIWLSLSVGLWLLAISSLALWVQINDQRVILLQQEQERAQLAADTLLSSLETIMMTGDGSLARGWINRIDSVPEMKSAQVLRANGDEAFRDLATIDKVNGFLGKLRFNRTPLAPNQETDLDPAQLTLAFSGQSLNIGDLTGRQLTHLLPIKLHEHCRVCHGYYQGNVIAVLRLTTNLEATRRRINRILSRDLAINLFTILAVATVLYLLVYRWVIAPVRRLNIAIRRVASGDVDTPVTLIQNDELGMLGAAMNEMVIELRHTMVSRKFVTSITDSILNALFVVDGNGVLQAVNPAACTLLGYHKDELLGQSLRKILAPGSVAENFCGGSDRLREVREVEQGFLNHDGMIIPVLISSGPILGMPGSRVCVAQSLSDYKRMERALQLSNKSLRDVVMRHHTGVLVANAKGQVLFANHAAGALLGQDAERLPGSLIDFPVAAGTTEIDRKRPQQRRTVTKLSMTEIDWEGQRSFLVMLEDVTDRREAEDAMVHMAYHDALTGLPNRILFLDCLNQALARARLSGEIVAILFLDLDRFKAINDTLGHSCGDQLLQEVSARLRDTVRKGDTVARMGSDEFTILLEGVKRDAPVESIARKILRIFNAPFYLQEHSLYITSSIGISLFPGDGSNPDNLLKHADTAMHHAKEQGRNQICLYQADLSDRLAARLLLERQLREALEEDKLRLFYQPQVDLKNGKLIGLEALLRWQHPEHGLISIGPFIPILEETGLITAVGAWCLDETCRQLRQWQDAGLPVVQTSVNLSAVQLKNCDIMATVERCLVTHRIDAYLLGLELTESTVMTNMNEALALLAMFAEQGIGLALDDFGTGYSSLGVLRQLPVQIIKLDRSFVQEIPHCQQDSALAAAVIAMAHRLGKQVVAEGVETVEQQEFLAQEHCDYGQGYLFGHPMPGDQIVPLLERL